MFTKFIKPACLIGPCILLVSFSALADTYSPRNISASDSISGIYSITIEQTGTVPSVYVQSDGNKYTAVKPGQSVTWQAKTRGVCRMKRKIREYRWWLNDNTQANPHAYYSHHKVVTKKDWITSKSKHDKYEVQNQISLPVSSKLANHAVQSCNNYLKAELGKGKAVQNVLSQKKTLQSLENNNPVLSGVVYMQCNEDSGMNTMLAHAWQNVRVNYICDSFAFPEPPEAPKPGVQSHGGIGKLAAPFTLEQPKVQVTPDKYSGQCPVDLQVEGTLKANQGQKKVQYRWSHKGALGPVAMATLNTSGWRSVNTVLKDIGKTAQDGKGFAIAPQQPNKQPLNVKALPDNVKTGHVELLALAEGQSDWSKAKVSSKAFYQATCKEPIKPAVATLAIPTPKPVQKSDLTPGDTLTIANATGAWGSKLMVDASKFNGKKRGDSCELRMAYDVKNIGQGAAGQFTSQLFEQAQTMHQENIPSLAAGSSKKISGNIYLSDGSHMIGVFVDNQQQLDESSESNNKQRISVEVKGCSTPAPQRSGQTAPPPRR